MARERVQTRADADTLDQLEQYAADKEISQSEAVRRLIRTGLAQKGYRDAEAGDIDGSTLERAGQAGTLITILAAAALGLILGIMVM